MIKMNNHYGPQNMFKDAEKIYTLCNNKEWNFSYLLTLNNGAVPLATLVSKKMEIPFEFIENSSKAVSIISDIMQNKEIQQDKNEIHFLIIYIRFEANSFDKTFYRICAKNTIKTKTISLFPPKKNTQDEINEFIGNIKEEPKERSGSKVFGPDIILYEEDMIDGNVNENKNIKFFWDANFYNKGRK